MHKVTYINYSDRNDTVIFIIENVLKFTKKYSIKCSKCTVIMGLIYRLRFFI